MQEREVRDYVLEKKIGLSIADEADFKKAVQLVQDRGDGYRELLDNISRIELQNGLDEFCALALKQVGTV